MCSIMGYCGVCDDLEAFQKGFAKTISRGPDDSRIVDTGNGLLGFHRLAIMGLTAVSYTHLDVYKRQERSEHQTGTGRKPSESRRCGTGSGYRK